MAVELEPDERNAYRSFLLAHSRVVDRIEARLAAAGMPPMGWYDVLYTIYAADNRVLRMFELADAIVMSRSGLTRLVDRLEREGLIERRSCPSDRRGQFVVVTDAGADVLRRMWPVYREAIREHFTRHLEDPSAVASELGRIADANATVAVS